MRVLASTGEPSPPNIDELGRIAQQAEQAARKTTPSEDECPYGEDDPQRRSKWLREFRRWRVIMRGKGPS